MNKRRLIAAALGTSLLASALPGLALAQDEETNFAAEGVQWALSTMAGDPVPEQIEVTMFLSGGEVVGNAGCNSYFGTYEIGAATLVFPNPFGVTQMLCDGPAQAIEDAYLPLLQSTAGWFMDAEGVLTLADADGNATLTFGEPAIDVTATDVDTLNAELAALQADIDELTAAAESLASKDINKRLKAVEDSTEFLEGKVGNVNSQKQKDRITVNEKDIAQLQKEVKNLQNEAGNMNKRVKALEASDKEQNKVLNDHEKRIEALEEAVPVPEPQS